MGIFDEPGVYTHEADPRDKDLGIGCDSLPRRIGGQTAAAPKVHGAFAVAAGLMLVVTSSVVDVASPFGGAPDSTVSVESRHHPHQDALHRLEVSARAETEETLPRRGDQSEEATDDEFRAYMAGLFFREEQEQPASGASIEEATDDEFRAYMARLFFQDEDGASDA